MSAELDRAVALLNAIASHAVYRFPVGTVGGNQHAARQREPRVGDFVYVTGTLSLDIRNTGWLRKLAEGANEYFHQYEVQHIDGTRTTWTNCSIHAVAIGNPFVEDIEAVFRSEEHAP